MKFLEHRIADKRALRLIRKWLSAGVIEDGEWSATLEGSPQGASASPLLANVYLHYLFDRWAQQWRCQHAPALYPTNLRVGPQGQCSSS
jgi:RNA-directed DNA polymerase